jgi:hypothetical protein
MEDDLKKRRRKKGRRPKKTKRRRPQKQWNTDQSTKINLIGCDHYSIYLSFS